MSPDEKSGSPRSPEVEPDYRDRADSSGHLTRTDASESPAPRDGREGRDDDSAEELLTDAPRAPRGGFPFVTGVVVAALIGALAGGGVAYRVASDQASVLPPTANAPRTTAPPGSLAGIVEAIKPSVVAISTEVLTPDSVFDLEPRQGAGTGIVLDAEGHVLTNSHVISGARTVEVVLPNGRRPATIVGADPTADLAVIKVDATGLTPAPLGDSNALRVGDRVVAVGNALNLPGGPTVTEGIVSALNRSLRGEGRVVLENLIQTDAAINPGNSGGPLLDSSGRVVGINTAIIGDAQNIGFSIAISPARPIIEQLIKTGKVTRAFLGVLMVDVTPEFAAQQQLNVRAGAFVGDLVDGGPAQAAGIREGDVITEVGGVMVKSADDVKREILLRKPGDRLRVVVDRGGRSMEFTAVLGEQ